MQRRGSILLFTLAAIASLTSSSAVFVHSFGQGSRMLQAVTEYQDTANVALSCLAQVSWAMINSPGSQVSTENCGTIDTTPTPIGGPGGGGGGGGSVTRPLPEDEQDRGLFIPILNRNNSIAIDLEKPEEMDPVFEGDYIAETLHIGWDEAANPAAVIELKILPYTLTGGDDGNPFQEASLKAWLVKASDLPTDPAVSFSLNLFDLITEDELSAWGFTDVPADKAKIRYKVRLKALYDDVTDLIVVAQDDNGDDQYLSGWTRIETEVDGEPLTAILPNGNNPDGRWDFSIFTKQDLVK